MSIVKRGEIYYADLSPVVGSEQGGVRPVLIVQNDTGNRHSPTVIAAAITSRLDKAKLPTPDTVDGWDAQTFAKTLRHDESEPLYNPSFRQLVHVSFKVAAELAGEYYPALDRNLDIIGREIEANIGERHVRRLFEGRA